MRFERDERACLGALASRPYSPIGVLSAAVAAPRRPPQRIDVQRRPLSVYAEVVR